MKDNSGKTSGQHPAPGRAGSCRFAGLLISALIIASLTCASLLPASAASAVRSGSALSSTSRSVSYTKEDEKKLLNVYKRETGNPDPYDFCVSDYNKDGKAEAFALAGEKDDFDVVTGSLYFVTEDKVTPVLTDKYFWPYEGDKRLLCFDTCDFYLIGEYYTTGDATYVFGVNKKGFYEHPFSRQGMALTQVGRTKDMTVILSDYDAGKDVSSDFTTGHTWKKYYLYWNGDFKEYGGLQISEADLLTCKGASKYTDAIKKGGYKIDSIYYRENGLININYSKSDSTFISYENMTLKLTGNTVKAVEVNPYGSDLLSKLTYSGIYYPALYPNMATYPKAFKPAAVKKTK